MLNTSGPDLTARKDIDVAVGILMGLRRCSEAEAFQKIADAVHQTGVPLSETARALILLTQPDRGSVAHRAEASRIWGPLLES